MPQTVGLALGSGGARGWAHIGVLRALEEADIKIDYVAGTSIGAVVGAFYAIGELDALEEFVYPLDWKKIVSFLDVVFPRQGLLDGDKVYSLLAEHLRERQMEDTLTPFCCVSTNLTTRQAVCLDSGSMVDAVRASLSIPGIFTPAQREGSYLVDGGLVNPIPIDVVRNMGAEVVIAVDLNNSLSHSEAEQNPDVISESKPDQEEYQPRQGQTEMFASVERAYRTVQGTVQDKIDQWMPSDDPSPNIFDVIGNSINVIEQGLARSNMDLHPPDILIEVDLQQIGIFDFHQATPAVKAGYAQMKGQLEELQQLLS
ncbi:putative NTE family protein [Acaryochloris thomasi RCC1774]|uniref:Putative NTE family protein n=1 Tax=Acaryochloris thomasi RCC1774 TaxID=1764569 RepID=A0A2W1JQM8_9CYAN|nr:patatin-like phospholipase family protein [Acaryochloris thomasi]PZD71217.1 putative NTE family protein [Acaryochloris thomasi RCC1774]